jgi:hypothetical protein
LILERARSSSDSKFKTVPTLPKFNGTVAAIDASAARKLSQQ